MKKLYTLAAAAIALPILFTSCSVYQLNTIASTNTERNEVDGSFVQENDSLKIIYSFNGENAPVSIEIHNKLNEPLLIDWQRSAILYNDSAVSYAGNKAAISGTINGTSYQSSLLASDPYYKNFTFNKSTVNGTITLPQYSDFIPPHAFIKRVPLSLTDVFFENFSDTIYKKVSIPSNEDYSPIKGKRAVFSATNSPLTFSSYLTFGSAGSDKKVSYQQRFYIAELITLPSHPNNTALMEKRGDMFFVSKQTGAGKALAGVGTVVAVSAIATTSVINNNSTHNGGTN